MTESPILRLLREKPLTLALCFAVILIIAKAAVAALDMESAIVLMGNDDVTRLLMVRDLIAGQGWYDTIQYRFAPPEGVDIHWSRYIDLGIAAIIVPLSWFMPMQSAEILGAMIWPTVIFLITIFVMAYGARRLFGPVPAAFTVLATVLWPLTADLHSSAGNLDHHNVQMLMMILLTFAVIWPTRPVAAGIVGGLAAGFSLSTGLESLLYIIAAGGVFLGRSAFDRSPATDRLLLAFCASLLFGSLVFWAGLIPPSRMLQPVCDQFGTPAISLILVAVVASVLPVLVLKDRGGAFGRLGAAVVLTGIGLALAWPLLGPCLAGPYGNLPEDLQLLMTTRITEAKPGLVYMGTHTIAAMILLIPVFVAFVAGLIWWVANRGRKDRVHATMGLLLIISTFGIAMIFVQMRTVIMLAPVVPLIGGVVIAALLHRYLEKRDIGSAILMLLTAVAISAPRTIAEPLRPFLQNTVKEATLSELACRDYESITVLNEIPPAILMTHGNFGPTLVWATHHDSMASGYHRSATSIGHALRTFSLEEEAFRDALLSSPAEFLHLCRGYGYDRNFLRALAAEEKRVDWLRPVPLESDLQMLFEVVR